MQDYRLLFENKGKKLGFSKIQRTIICFTQGQTSGGKFLKHSKCVKFSVCNRYLSIPILSTDEEYCTDYFIVKENLGHLHSAF